MSRQGKSRITLISEPVEPARDSFDTERMAAGEPGLPYRFTWRKKKYDVVDVLETWKTTGPCRSGSSEKYVRKHYFKVLTESGETMTLYCNRQTSRHGDKTKGRWILYSMLEHQE